MSVDSRHTSTYRNMEHYLHHLLALLLFKDLGLDFQLGGAFGLLDSILLTLILLLCNWFGQLCRFCSPSLLLGWFSVDNPSHDKGRLSSAGQFGKGQFGG